MRLPTQLLRRKNNSHKGDFGHVFVVAGSARYSGAGALCSEAALRSGAGLVTLGIPKSLNNAIIEIKPKEVMTLPLPETKHASLSAAAFRKIKDFARTIDVLAIGPGLSQDKSTQSLVRKVVAEIDKSMVIDADGLNALAGHLNLLPTTNDQRPTTILTPHPGEMARLLGISAQKVQKAREKIAKVFSKKYKVTVVLKGHKTVVCDGTKLFVNTTGNPGMATAGSGDVLTGMIAAFLAQGIDSYSAAKYAVYLHGLAGDLAAEEKTQISLIASDIIAKIPKAIKLSS